MVKRIQIERHMKMGQLSTPSSSAGGPNVELLKTLPSPMKSTGGHVDNSQSVRKRPARPTTPRTAEAWSTATRLLLEIQIPAKMWGKSKGCGPCDYAMQTRLDGWLHGFDRTMDFDSRVRELDANLFTLEMSARSEDFAFICWPIIPERSGIYCDCIACSKFLGEVVYDSEGKNSEKVNLFCLLYNWISPVAPTVEKVRHATFRHVNVSNTNESDLF